MHIIHLYKSKSFIVIIGNIWGNALRAAAEGFMQTKTIESDELIHYRDATAWSRHK